MSEQKNTSTAPERMPPAPSGDVVETAQTGTTHDVTELLGGSEPIQHGGTDMGPLKRGGPFVAKQFPQVTLKETIQ